MRDRPAAGQGRQPPAIISISSHVARGSVGNRAIVFALETLGIPVWAVNTVALPFHPGHGKATRIEPDTKQFSDLLDDLLESPWIGEVGAVATGYMVSADQAEAVGRFIGKLKRRNDGIVHFCDPIIGDRNGLYVAEATAAAIRDHLLVGADFAMPNIHELAWLAGCETPADPAAIAATARQLDVATVVVTSVPGMMRGHVGNLLVGGDDVVLAEHRLLDGPPNGPGDLTAGLFLAHIALGEAPVRALEKATASVFEIIARAARRGADELMLAADRASIIRAMASVTLRNIVVRDPTGA